MMFSFPEQFLSCRVALQFTHEMQSKAQKNYDASRDRALPVFGVGVAFIDEKAISAVSSDNLDRAVEEMKLIVSDLAPPVKQFHVVPTEAIYSLKAGDAKDRLNELINTVNDVTGKEDLLEHFRMLSLQKVWQLYIITILTFIGKSIDPYLYILLYYADSYREWIYQNSTWNVYIKNSLSCT